MSKRIKSRKRETVPNIRMWDDPVLKEVCEPVKQNEDVTSIVRGMIQALNKAKNGVGLAAPQIGVTKRIIVILANGFPRVMINPEIMFKSEESQTRQEGCLSYPGRFVDVERSCRIECQFENEYRLDSRFFFGFEARIIQHETDHLDGICKVAP